jgi:hypothetical protein
MLKQSILIFSVVGLFAGSIYAQDEYVRKSDIKPFINVLQNSLRNTQFFNEYLALLSGSMGLCSLLVICAGSKISTDIINQNNAPIIFGISVPLFLYFACRSMDLNQLNKTFARAFN